MYHMAMLRIASLDVLSHALLCHRDHLEDARSELSDSARGALNGTDYVKFDTISKEITSISTQLNLLKVVEDEIAKSKRIGHQGGNMFQFSMYSEWGAPLHLIMENYVEMQYDMLRGELLSVTRGELTVNPANVVLNALKGEDALLERTVEGAFLEGYFKALS